MAFKAQSIHNLLFGDEEQKPAQKRQGRSQELHRRRNEAFIDRYYFEGRNNPNMQSDKLVELVAEQFFISSYRAYIIIGENLDRLIQLKKNAPNDNFFRMKWPQYKW